MALQQFILKPKPVSVILSLKDASQNWYPSKLAKASGASYVYVVNSLEKLRKAGWVRFEERGRLKTVFLTEKGQQAASSLDELVRKIQLLSASDAPATPKPEPAQAHSEKEAAKS